MRVSQEEMATQFSDRIQIVWGEISLTENSKCEHYNGWQLQKGISSQNRKHWKI